MNVQLILFPQYDVDNSAGNISTVVELVTDGQTFSTLNASPSYCHDDTTSYHIISRTPPGYPNYLIPNIWYRAKYDPFDCASPPTPAPGNYIQALYPTSNAGSVKFCCDSEINLSSQMYQKLSNVIPGVPLTFELKLMPGQVAGGLLSWNFLEWIGGNTYPNVIIPTPNTGYVSSDDSTIKSCSFVPTQTEVYLFLEAVSLYGDDPLAGYPLCTVLDYVSVLQTQMLPDPNAPIDTGQVICDLYEDEDIPLTLSIDDFKNVAEKTQSYSKSFKLPGTKRNNKIFDHIFEITRTTSGLTYNPFLKTKAILKQDSIVIFEGTLSLIDITDTKGEISYNVNLFSQSIALKDFLSTKTFNDIDLTELEHTYNKTQIKNTWYDFPSPGLTYLNPNTSGFRHNNDTVKYPFVDWTHQYTNSATNTPVLPTLEGTFRPWIQIKYLIDRIFADSPFNYTSSFLNSAEFRKLYMDFNWGGNSPATGCVSYNNDSVIQTSVMGWQPYYLDQDNLPPGVTFDVVAQTFYVDADNTQISITLDLAWLNYSNASYTEYELWVEDPLTGLSDQINPTIWGQGMGPFWVQWNQTYYYTLNAGAYFRIMVYSSYTMDWQGAGSVCVGVGYTNVTTTNLLTNLRGKLGQWDFLKGIMTMFNLVTIANNNDPNDLIIEPYADIFNIDTNSGTTSDLSLEARGIVRDWTDKIDITDIKLTPLLSSNRYTNFVFALDKKDYFFTQYQQGTDHDYGSLMFDAGFDILQGTKEITAKPFAATLCKPLNNSLTNFVIPTIYTRTEAGVSSSYDNLPRICYNNGIKATGISNTPFGYYIPAQNGLFSENQSNFLQFSHLSDIPTVPSSNDYHWGACQLSSSAMGSSVVNNLYYRFWAPYYNELYNADTKTMTIKVNLTPSDINTFKFTDRVFIKNREFRVNKIDYKPNNLAIVEFILIP